MLHCEVLQTCFITGNVLTFNAATGEFARQGLHDHIVYPGTLVEVDDATPLEVDLGAPVKVLRVIRKFVGDVEVPFGVADAPIPGSGPSEAELLSAKVTVAENLPVVDGPPAVVVPAPASPEPLASSRKSK